jgi:hypothetical protein
MKNRVSVGDALTAVERKAARTPAICDTHQGPSKLSIGSKTHTDHITKPLVRRGVVTSFLSHFHWPSLFLLDVTTTFCYGWSGPLSESSCSLAECACE